MRGNQSNVQKAINFRLSTNENEQGSTSTFQNYCGIRKSGKNKENSHGGLTVKIPLSHVVSTAQTLRTEARCAKQLDLVQKSCKIDEFCKEFLNKGRKTCKDHDTVSILANSAIFSYLSG